MLDPYYPQPISVICDADGILWPYPSTTNPHLGRALGFFNFMVKIMSFLHFCRAWYLGGFGNMENTPTGCADDLLKIQRIFKNDPPSRSVSNFLQREIALLVNQYRSPSRQRGASRQDGGF